MSGSAPQRRPAPTIPWVTKYRPETLEQLALSDTRRAKLESWLHGNAPLPHLLLYGPPGVGKTTLVEVIRRSLDASVLELNGASERGIDTMRNEVRNFCRALGLTGRLKLVCIDEADQLTIDAQAALHRMMETYAHSTRFLFTCNRVEQIDAPLQSRCEMLEFRPVPVEERMRVLAMILQAEGYTVPESTLLLFASRFTDMRKMVQAAATSFDTHGTLKIPPAPAGEPRLLAEIVEDPDYDAEVRFDLSPYTAPGRLTLLTGPPKLAGKSTWARHYGAAKASGGRFLGAELDAGPVLWVGPDESQHDTAREFRKLAASTSPIYIWQLAPDVEAIAEKASALNAGLVVLDTLPLIARIAQENDNAAWIAWSRRALPLIRTSSAVWLGIHHHRKTGGTGGAGIRGASAIFGMVDVALSLLPLAHSPQSRELVIEGSRFTAPGSRRISLTDDGYVDRGETPPVREPGPSSRQQLIPELLGSREMTVAELHEGLREHGYEYSDQTLRDDLKELVALKVLDSNGEGVRGDPRVYHVID